DQDMADLSAALLMMAQGDRKLILPPEPAMDRRPRREFRDRDDRGRRDDRRDGRRDDRPRREGARDGDRPERRERRDAGPMDVYRIEVGREDGVEVRHIVGAIANEGDLSSRYIGNIKLFDSHSTVELPRGMPTDLLDHFTRTRILNKPIRMQLVGEATARPAGDRPRGDRPPRREGDRPRGDRPPRREGGERRGGFGNGERRSGERSHNGERRERPAAPKE
ncbi:MAG: DbpA RNA binding domain-containing protein, partial [Plesiomonas sp.]